MKRFFAIWLFFVITLCSAGERGLPAREGIANFGKVNEELYRGSQPDAEAIKNLKRLGINSIVCLRTSGKDWRKELAAAQAQGIICTNIPLSGVHRPKTEQVKQALAAIKALPAPVYVHCQYGCDRTGTVIACYRIQHDNWSGETALEEAKRYGISRLQRGMRDFILDFAKSKR